VDSIESVLKKGVILGALHDYDKILTRLTIILQRLYEGESLSVGELSKEFGVSTKTLQRDFNERLVRFPIQKEGRKWKMMDGFALEKKRSSEEILILDVLSQIAEGVGYEFGSKAKMLFSKLQNLEENPVFSKIPIEDLSGKTELFGVLQQAIKDKKVISFNYKKSKRTINPYKIVSFEGFWYLYGKELSDNKLKTYYLKEITQTKVEEESFVKDEFALERLKYAINTWFEPNSPLFEVKLLAKKEVAKYFHRRPLSLDQQIVSDETGEIITLKATSKQEILHEVKRWMPSLLILEPELLREESIALAKLFLRESEHL